jgi:beta-mannosidase
MGARNFVSRDTGHRLVQGFRPDDFKFWYDASVGYVTPLLETTFCAEEWEPILASGNGSWESGEWKPTLAAAERADGEGEWRVCNVKLAGRIQGNPVARIFATRLLQAL